MIDEKTPQIILHKGVFKKTASVSEAVFMITGMTIGAGILGIPYVVSRSGLVVGLLYIVVLGTVMLSLNLMIGDIAVRTGQNFQLPGFAGKYLGPWAGKFVSTMFIFTSFGVLLAYVIGEGQTLSALFGGSPVGWSLLFWSLGSIFLWKGLETVKKIERILSFLVITIIVILSLYLFNYFIPATWYYVDIGNLFLPYGVILFALSGGAAVAEAHALLPGSERRFKKAIIIGSLIPVLVYVLFAIGVVGVLGLGTTEVATVGLGQKFGPVVVYAANIFASLAMGTAFLAVGMALKQTLVWDSKAPKWGADILVILVPAILFLFGIRSFILILDLVGGLFLSAESIILVLAAYRARKIGDLPAIRYNLKHFWPLAVPILIVFSLMTVYSIIKLVF